MPFALHLPFGSTGLKVGNRLKGFGLAASSLFGCTLSRCPRISCVSSPNYSHNARNPLSQPWNFTLVFYFTLGWSDLLPSVCPPSTKHLLTNFPRCVDSQPCCSMNSSTLNRLSSKCFNTSNFPAFQCSSSRRLPAAGSSGCRRSSHRESLTTQ